jgi:hypothetical protein
VVIIKKDFIVNKAKFIYTKDEFGYQEVLDDFANADNITIITFNISEKQTYLLDCLKKVPDNSEIKIITNIPNRWEMYYQSKYRDFAKKKINVYLTKLKPEEIGGKVSVFFNFDNHGKIIMTNNIAYIGSSNYSEESKANVEFGFLSKDKEFLNYLSDEVINDISSDALPYYDYNYMPLLLELNMAISALFSLNNELYEQIYLFYDDIGGNGFYYNSDYDLLSYKTISNIDVLMQDINDIGSEIYNAINKITNEDEDVEEIAKQYYETLLDISKTYEQFMYKDTIYELANFHINDYINKLLQDEYSLEAFDEKLDYYIEICSDRAQEKLNDMCNSAENDLKGMLEIINDYIKTTKNLLELFQKYNIVQINPNIDNTKN